MGRLLGSWPLPALGCDLLFLEPPRLGELPGSGLSIPAALMRLREQKAPRRLLRGRRDRSLEVINRGAALTLLQPEDPSSTMPLKKFPLFGMMLPRSTPEPVKMLTACDGS